jgi:hypothetical protein
MERVKIIKRSGPNHSWYNDYVGQWFPVVDKKGNEIQLNIGNGDLRWIDQDCVEYDQPTQVEPDPIASNPLLVNMIETFNKCFATAVKKNNDYGGSNNDPFANFRNSTIAGVSVEKGILVRLMDKMSRISTLLDKEAMVKDESITDTIEDAINYLAIMKAYINLKNQTNNEIH